MGGSGVLLLLGKWVADGCWRGGCRSVSRPRGCGRRAAWAVGGFPAVQTETSSHVFSVRLQTQCPEFVGRIRKLFP